MSYKTLSAPITCQIELTTGCNNDCLYCYNHWRHDKTIDGANMHDELLDLTLNQIIDARVFQVTFTGGETLLRKKQLFRGIDRLISADVSCAVNTNLTTLTDSDARELYRLGLRGILTSLCSHDRTRHDFISQRKGSFDDTLRGIKKAQDAGLFVAASMVITSLNAHDVLPAGLFLKELGVQQMFATKASPPVNALGFQHYMITHKDLMNTLEDLNVLRNEHGMNVGILECYPLCSYGDTSRFPFVADRRCSAGITTCTIGASGEIRPCSHSDISYGNISTEGLLGAWNAMEDQRDGSLLPPTCKECTLLASCSGGCRVDAFCYSGRYDTLDPYAQPQLVQSVITKQPTFAPINGRDHFRVNPQLHIRNESMGVLCADSSAMGTPALLTSDTYELVQQLEKDSFSVDDVTRITGLDITDANTLCGMLLHDKILLRSS